MTERLPELLDAKHLAGELGVTRAAAEKIMLNLPIVQVPGLRKVYVRRRDVTALLERCTFQKRSGAGVGAEAGGSVSSTPPPRRLLA